MMWNSPVQSPESMDGGERLQESSRKDAKSPVPSSRSHSRANSEAFATPASTPPDSPLLLTHLTATPPNPHRAHIFSRHHHSHQWNSLPHVVQWLCHQTHRELETGSPEVRCLLVTKAFFPEPHTSKPSCICTLHIFCSCNQSHTYTSDAMPIYEDLSYLVMLYTYL